jgi:hypothetical protein
MLFEQYAGYRLAVAEHEERLRKAANDRLAARVAAATASPGEHRHDDSGLHVRALVEQIWRCLVGRGSAASAALK